MTTVVARDGEDVAHVLQDLLRGSAFVDSLARVWAARATAVPFVEPAIVYTAEKQTPDRYPACELILMDDDESDATSGVRVTVHTDVHWSIVGDDEEIMDLQLKRYMRATRMLLSGITMAPNFPSTRLRCGRTDYSILSTARTAAGVTGKYVRSASLETYVDTFA